MDFLTNLTFAPKIALLIYAKKCFDSNSQIIYGT